MLAGLRTNKVKLCLQWMCTDNRVHNIKNIVKVMVNEVSKISDMSDILQLCRRTYRRSEKQEHQNVLISICSLIGMSLTGLLENTKCKWQMRPSAYLSLFSERVRHLHVSQIHGQLKLVLRVASDSQSLWFESLQWREGNLFTNTSYWLPREAT